jgi:hemerythrin-like metal-binding protein
MAQTPLRAVEEIDLDHQELFRQLAELRSALRAGIHSEVASTLGFVRRYVDSHFAREEQAMSATRYPLFHVHRAAHGRLGREVRALEAEWSKSGVTPVFADSVLEALTEWFEVHVLELDAQLVRHLKTVHAPDPALRWKPDLSRRSRPAR